MLGGLQIQLAENDDSPVLLTPCGQVLTEDILYIPLMPLELFYILSQYKLICIFWGKFCDRPTPRRGVG